MIINTIVCDLFELWNSSTWLSEFEYNIEKENQMLKFKTHSLKIAE